MGFVLLIDYDLVNDFFVSAQRYPSVEYVFTNVPSDVDDPSLSEIESFYFMAIEVNVLQYKLTHFPMDKHHFGRHHPFASSVYHHLSNEFAVSEINNLYIKQIVIVTFIGGLLFLLFRF